MSFNIIGNKHLNLVYLIERLQFIVVVESSPSWVSIRTETLWHSSSVTYYFENPFWSLLTNSWLHHSNCLIKNYRPHKWTQKLPQNEILNRGKSVMKETFCKWGLWGVGNEGPPLAWNLKWARDQNRTSISNSPLHHTRNTWLMYV